MGLQGIIVAFCVLLVAAQALIYIENFEERFKPCNDIYGPGKPKHVMFRPLSDPAANRVNCCNFQGWVSCFLEVFPQEGPNLMPHLLFSMGEDWSEACMAMENCED